MTETTIWNLDGLKIGHGSHKPPNGAVQACAMEAAYLRWAMRQGWDKRRIIAGWTDKLDCVCPYIGAFVRRWNDGIGESAEADATRTRIFTPDLLDRLPGTKGSDALMLRRMWAGIDWDIRTRTPAFLSAANLDAEAVALESLPEIVSQESLNNACAVCEAARQRAAAAGSDVYDITLAAAGGAAWKGAWSIARTSAGAAAGAAASVAARTEAIDAAWAAARDAAWSASKKNREASVIAMQDSAKQLIVRLCDMKDSA